MTAAAAAPRTHMARGLPSGASPLHRRERARVRVTTANMPNFLMQRSRDTSHRITPAGNGGRPLTLPVPGFARTARDRNDDYLECTPSLPQCLRGVTRSLPSYLEGDSHGLPSCLEGCTRGPRLAHRDAHTAHRHAREGGHPGVRRGVRPIDSEPLLPTGIGTPVW